MLMARPGKSVTHTDQSLRVTVPILGFLEAGDWQT
jgi:hypothetical protein